MLLFPISFGRSCYNSSHFPNSSAVLMWVLYLEAFSDFCRQKSHCYRWVECPGSSPSPLSGAPDLQQHKNSRFSQGCLLLPGVFSFPSHVLWPLPSLHVLWGQPSDLPAPTLRLPVLAPRLLTSCVRLWGPEPSLTGCLSTSLSPPLFPSALTCLLRLLELTSLPYFSLTWVWMAPVAFSITPAWGWLIQLLQTFRKTLFTLLSRSSIICHLEFDLFYEIVGRVRFTLWWNPFSLLGTREMAKESRGPAQLGYCRVLARSCSAPRLELQTLAWRACACAGGSITTSPVF